MQKISLYVPCFNVEKYIAPCIEGILSQTYPIDEILIIDDGSRDRTVEIASQYPVRIIKHEVNKGLAAGRNTAIRNARNELVASLDADCVAESNWLEKLVALIEEDEKIALVGGRLVETVQKTIADKWRTVHMAQHWGDNRLLNPPYIHGNNVLIRKSVVEEVGWYNETCRTNGEDVNISKRIYERGYKALYDPEVIVKHIRQDTIPSLLATFWRYLRSGSLPTYHNVTVKTFLYNIYFVHFKQLFICFIYRDLKLNKNYHLLGLDILLPVYMTYLNLKLLIEYKTKKIN